MHLATNTQVDLPEEIDLERGNSDSHNATEETKPIWNGDISVEVILLDVSSSKDYVSYFTHQRLTDNTNLKGLDKEGNLTDTTFITRRRFTENRAFDSDIAENDMNNHFSLDITKYMLTTLEHCYQFLLVSPDGKYVALSFYELEFYGLQFDTIVTQRNTECLIFRYNICSISTLIIWAHAIKRLRVVPYIGVTLETIIQITKNLILVLFIMFLVVFAFTSAFIVLLRQKSDECFQERYGGITSDNSAMSILDDSSSNGFKDVYKSFYQVWMLIYGVWDPISDGDAGNNKTIMTLSILFTFVTVLIFVNLVIALMSMEAEEVKNRGRKSWVNHFAAVIAEIEILWCSESERRSRRNNPIYIYYIADREVVKRHEKILQEETEKWRKHFNFTS